ncbi:GAF domain-containing protein [Flammeovirga sp. EKP202]|uniref:GAF domain-containing protein n=1 Tax=Flammeovirga sp. EKP202 TaxID=2770592 RepID=UPI00165F7890|nr:GAF domain-containing protein [Flammeovirga sp. EKP202]MBD0401127.1 GAF domain-containing protein [Flammeovirga sp. EKP202]
MKTTQKRTNIREKNIHTVYKVPAIVVASIFVFIFSTILIFENQFPGSVKTLILGNGEYNREKYLLSLGYIDLVFVIILLYLIFSSRQVFNIILGVIFLFLSFFSTSSLYNLPEQILSALERKDDKTYLQIMDLSTPTFYTLGFTFAILIFLLFRLVSELMKDPEDHIIYVPKYFSKESQKREEETKDTFRERGQLIKKNIQASILNIEDGDDKEQILLNSICREFQVSTGIYYKTTIIDGKNMISFSKGFSFYLPESQTLAFEFGEGLPGQVASTRSSIISNTIPENYIKVVSGLGDSTPNSLMIAPILDAESNLLGVVELASFKNFTPEDREILDKVTIWFTES